MTDLEERTRLTSLPLVATQATSISRADLAIRIAKR